MRSTPAGPAAQESGPTEAALVTRRLSRAETLAAQLPPLLVAAERVAATVSQGVHGRRRVGEGEAFWQFRRYQPGDTTQRIDWRQSAKTDRVYIRETEWEAAQSVWLWCDRSASMRWRSGRSGPTKIERAELLLLALAALLIRGGEHVTLMGHGMPPSPGRVALRRLAALLSSPRAAESAEMEPGAGLPAAEPLPRHGRVVWFADFLAPPEAIQAAISGFARRGVRGHLVQIADAAEETLPFSGRVLFAGSENEGELLFGAVDSIREEYRSVYRRHLAAVGELASAFGWTLLTHRTDHPPETALLALYQTLGGGGR